MRLIKRLKLFKLQMMQTFRSVVALFTNNFFSRKTSMIIIVGIPTQWKRTNWGLV